MVVAGEGVAEVQNLPAPVRPSAGASDAGQALLRRYDFLVGVLGLSAPGLGASPITDFSGQTDTAGHCLQLAMMAIGQSVMAVLGGL
jgi:hypothetical protein